MHKDVISGTGMAVATNSSLIGLKIHSKGRKSCLVVKPSQFPRVSKVIAFRKESAHTTLLDKHNSLSYYKSYPYTHR